MKRSILILPKTLTNIFEWSFSPQVYLSKNKKKNKNALWCTKDLVNFELIWLRLLLALGFAFRAS